MPRGKSLPGGACPGARVYQGGHAPGQGFTRGGACHGARDLATSLIISNMKASTILVLLGIVAMVSMFSAQPFSEFILFTNVMLYFVNIFYIVIL